MTPGTETHELGLNLLGEPEIRFRGRAVRLANRKLLCLLGYLALAPGGRESRERLVGLLWSESDEGRARGSLRQAMTAFRRMSAELGFEGFAADRAFLILDPAFVRLDVDAVRGALGPERVHPLLLENDDLPAALMKGCEDVDPAFGAWLAGQRAELRERLMRGLERNLHVAPPQGEDAARAMLRLDPGHERAARHVMECRSRAGDMAAALRVYNRLWRVLDEEYDMEPSAPTQSLVARIKSGGLEPEPRAPAAWFDAADEASERGPPLLIVEPFETAGDDPRARAVMEGFRHALIAGLVRFREWRVAECAGDGEGPAAAPPPDGPPGTASATGKPQGEEASPDAEPAEDRFRIRATAEPQCDGICVTLTLREAAGGVFVWSDRVRLAYDAPVRRQEALLSQLTIALHVNFVAQRLRRMRARATPGASLHDRWLKGQQLLTACDPADWAEAERLLRDLVRAAPDYAPAYAALSQISNALHIVHPGLMRSEAQHRRALETARRSAAIDPLDGRSQLAMGWSLALMGRWGPAMMSFELALQLNNNDHWTLLSVASARAFAGRHAEAAELAATAQEAPTRAELAAWACHAAIRFLGGDHEGALQAARRAGDVHGGAGMWRIAALARLGRVESARREAWALRDVLRRSWRGAAAPDDAAMTRWLLDLFPLRREADARRLREALALAGLPVEAASTSPDDPEGDWIHD